MTHCLQRSQYPIPSKMSFLNMHVRVLAYLVGRWFLSWIAVNDDMNCICYLHYLEPRVYDLLIKTVMIELMVLLRVIVTIIQLMSCPVRRWSRKYSAFTVDCHRLSRPLTTLGTSIEFKKFHMKDRCATYYGLILMTGVAGGSLPVVPDIHLVRYCIT